MNDGPPPAPPRGREGWRRFKVQSSKLPTDYTDFKDFYLTTTKTTGTPFWQGWSDGRRYKCKKSAKQFEIWKIIRIFVLVKTIKGLMFQGAIIVFSILVIFIAVCILPWWVSVLVLVYFIVAIFFPSKNPWWRFKVAHRRRRSRGSSPPPTPPRGRDGWRRGKVQGSRQEAWVVITFPLSWMVVGHALRLKIDSKRLLGRSGVRLCFPERLLWKYGVHLCFLGRLLWKYGVRLCFLGRLLGRKRHHSYTYWINLILCFSICFFERWNSQWRVFDGYLSKK